MKNAAKVFGVIASTVLFLLAGGSASADVGTEAKSSEAQLGLGSRANFDSLLGETLVSTSGSASITADDDFFWQVSISGLHYIAPRFGVGGSFFLSDSSYNDRGVSYGLGPMAEYFVSVSDRGHVFTRGSFVVSGQIDSQTSLTLAADLGYRYFVADNTALSAQLTKAWFRINSSSSSLQSDGLSLTYGFSLFF